MRLYYITIDINYLQAKEQKSQLPPKHPDQVVTDGSEDPKEVPIVQAPLADVENKCKRVEVEEQPKEEVVVDKVEPTEELDQKCGNVEVRFL